eukprot:TRINITY_DN29496_c0_g1_i1.p2 TRINITY_DN29496_c0_g1~~TRINITY_DN29496_c0_g1_i1.p2  ORF type:complete len:91 (-),score=3.54 TRINITY_DN29496_c0_g1_i1:74-346(-)
MLVFIKLSASYNILASFASRGPKSATSLHCSSISSFIFKNASVIRNRILLPSWRRQSQTRSVVSIGKIFTKSRNNQLVVIADISKSNFAK